MKDGYEAVEASGDIRLSERILDPAGTFPQGVLVPAGDVNLDGNSRIKLDGFLIATVGTLAGRSGTCGPPRIRLGYYSARRNLQVPKFGRTE
jgi:hypothetical protein